MRKALYSTAMAGNIPTLHRALIRLCNLAHLMLLQVEHDTAAATSKAHGKALTASGDTAGQTAAGGGEVSGVTKACSRCRIVKAASCFNNDRGKGDGLYCHCRCHSRLVPFVNVSPSTDHSTVCACLLNYEFLNGNSVASSCNSYSSNRVCLSCCYCKDRG